MSGCVSDLVDNSSVRILLGSFGFFSFTGNIGSGRCCWYGLSIRDECRECLRVKFRSVFGC